MTLAYEPRFLEGRDALELALSERLCMFNERMQLARSGDARVVNALLQAAHC